MHDSMTGAVNGHIHWNLIVQLSDKSQVLISGWSFAKAAH